jgi:hypothetical protein
MNIKLNRFIFLFVACSAAGVVVGGVSNWIDTHQCLHAEPPTVECLTQDPPLKTMQGMGSGLLAGAGAALGVTWQLKQQQKQED